MSALLFAQINVFDGVRPIGRTSVLVRDGLINAIGRRLDPPPGARVVDGAGRTLLPGLIDAHIHVTERAGAQAIGFGVTTQLDMFADPIAARGPRAAAAARTDVADLRSAGTGATATGGHPAQLVDAGLFPPFPTVDRPEQAAAFVADRIAEGSDYLKIFASGVPGEPGLPRLSRSTIAALIAAAHQRGLLAIAHATDADTALDTVAAGVDGLAHLPFDRPLTAPEAAMVAERGTFVVPTLTMIESFCQVRGGALFAADPRIGPRLSAEALANLVAVMQPPPTEPRYTVDNAIVSVGLLASAGVPLLAGTDALAPGTAHGASVHRELELLTAAGLSPSAALAGATALP